MRSFIADVISDLQSKEQDISDLTFILPNKRAGIFLKHEISKSLSKAILAPEIISIEEFVEELSGLKTESNLHLLFEFYSIYSQLENIKEIEQLDSFSKWAQILLQDFNEIDRFLIEPEKIFNYLSEIKDIEHWSLKSEKTDLVKNYLLFWKKLYPLYTAFSDSLKAKKVGYQGLIYREAVENLQNYIQSTKKRHVFIGFNALNSAEEIIIQEILENEVGEIYWDIDEHFINNTSQNAGQFIRKYKNEWRYFSNNPFKWAVNNYKKRKLIDVIGIPKNIGQAKYIGSILKSLYKEDAQLSNTAVILGDENLLIPVINSLPENVKALNITMGIPLESSPLSSFFESLLMLHKNKYGEGIYNRDIQIILTSPLIRPLFIENKTDYVKDIIDHIQTNNIIYIPLEKVLKLAPKKSRLLTILFGNWNNSPKIALDNSLALIVELKSHYSVNKKENLLILEYLFRYYEIFNQLNHLINTYNFVNDIKTLYSVYKELLTTENIDFKGEPLQGLQLMGMLESRVLDFETIIISSVNEGVLPSGKINNSFIPFDVKVENGMPTYREKDAIYSYHFFRLFQRAKNIYIIYNTESDALKGGEKSRFITQLEVEGIHNIKHTLASPKVPAFNNALNKIKKTDTLLAKIREVAMNGFSPSSLTSYIRNPLEFYYRKILKVNQYEDVEETVALNTLGNVVHKTLEDFYKPFVNSYLNIESLKKLIPKIDNAVTNNFKKYYKEGDLKNGKNLIIFEIAKRYVSNLINLEIENLKGGDEIKILQIESEEFKTMLDIPELDFPVYLTGKIDRVDEFNGVIRIIDYKTGKVEQNKMTVFDWDEINHDYDRYSKPYQILAYAYLFKKKVNFSIPIEAGVISFKNLNSGFLKFAETESKGSRQKDSNITQETLDSYFIQLKKLILEICNPNIDIIEKEV